LKFQLELYYLETNTLESCFSASCARLATNPALSCKKRYSIQRQHPARYIVPFLCALRVKIVDTVCSNVGELSAVLPTPDQYLIKCYERGLQDLTRLVFSLKHRLVPTWYRSSNSSMFPKLSLT